MAFRIIQVAPSNRLGKITSLQELLVELREQHVKLNEALRQLSLQTTQSTDTALTVIRSTPTTLINAADTEVLYRDGDTISGSPDFIFNDTLKQLVLGAGSQLLIDAGTAAKPGLAFRGDPNTGIWNESGDIVTITCAGGSKYRFANSYVTFAPAGGIGQFGLGGTVGVPNAYLFGDSAGVLRVTGVSTETKFVVKAGSAQSLNLQEWQNSGGTAMLVIDKDANLIFKNAGKGLPFGSCAGDEIAFSQASMVQNTWYPISDADIVDGQLNLITHDGSGKLTVTEPGKYMATYSVSIEMSGANNHAKLGFLVNGSIVTDGKLHVHFPNANEEFSITGNAILNLADNATVEVGVMNPDPGTPTATVDHLNLTLVQVGG